MDVRSADTQLEPWLPLMSAVTLLVTGEETIAVEFQHSVPKRRRVYQPPVVADDASDLIAVKRYALGHPADWSGKDNWAWLVMWAGDLKIVEEACCRLVAEVQSGRLRTQARRADHQTYQFIGPDKWARVTLVCNPNNGCSLVGTIPGSSSTLIEVSDLADAVVSRDDLLMLICRDSRPDFTEYQTQEAGREEPEVYGTVSPTGSSIQVQNVRKQGSTGGRPEQYYWQPFDHKVTEILALDGGNLSLRELRRRMRDWADKHMDPRPDDRTLDRHIDRLVPRHVLVGD
jgi:hypothetical protein